MAKYQANKQHAPIDENVAVPAAIRAAAARSDALHKQAYEEATAEPPAQAAPPAAEPPATQEAPPAQAAPPAAEPQPENWEQKYHTMRGRFEKTISGLNSRIAQLEQANSRQPEPAPQVRTPDLTFKPVTPEEKENFGEEFLDVAFRAAAEKFAPQIDKLNNELSQLKGTVTQVAQKSSEDIRKDMWRHLDGALPDWRALNNDPKFIAWANLPDPFSGAIRVSMMREAFEKGDGPRVLRFFHGFLNDEAATGPATTQTEVPKGKVPLETFAAPGRAKAPAASAPQTPEAGKELISQAQIASFYLDVQKGKYRGNEEEKNRLERMIFEAQADGRITA